MPTGYTEDLYDGKDVTFEMFVMGCARAFGACVTMRDDSFDTPIPDKFEPSDYHIVAKRKAILELHKYETMSDDEFKAEVDATHQKYMDSYRERLKKRRAMLQRYTAMLEQVQAWEPPTKEHVGLKEFMAKQLQESIDHDCYTPDEPKRQTWKEYRDLARDVARKDISYHEKELTKDEEWASERTAWVQSLRESIRLENSGKIT